MALVPYAASRADPRNELEAMIRSQQFTIASVNETSVAFAEYMEKMKEVVGTLVAQNKALESALVASLEKEKQTKMVHVRTIGELGDKATRLETQLEDLRLRTTTEMEAANTRILSEILAKPKVVKAVSESWERRAKDKETELRGALEAETVKSIAEAIKPVIKKTEDACAAESEVRKQALIAAHPKEVAKVTQEAREYLAKSVAPLKAYKKQMEGYTTAGAAQIGKAASELVAPSITRLEAPFPSEEEA